MIEKTTPFKTMFRKAFTVIEILIVVILVGIIVGAAIPAISQYQAAQARTVMYNDGQRIGAAVQVYFAETLERSVTLKYNPTNGMVTGPDAFRIQDGNKIATGYVIPGNEMRITFDTKESFTLKHPDGGSYTFSDKGELSRSE